jgi:acetate---CoA ligase (ADP-forming)
VEGPLSVTSDTAGLCAALKPLFQPAHVAIIGASSAPTKQGNAAIRYLKGGGYGGRISLVNPAGGTIEGLTCYRSIKEAPGEVDCALLVIPAAATVAAIRDCAEAGVRVAVIGSNGFAELGTAEGRARQAELTAIARASGMRLVGPNTNGIWNATDRLSLGYNTSHGDPLSPGPVSIAAHSGALFNSVAPRLRRYGAGLSKFVPVGNEADLDLLDFLEFFIADDATQVIGLIIEGLSDGRRLRDLAARARAAGKPIVALKLGRSTAGAGATVAHSSRLAGSARAYTALLRECRITTVRSIEALAGACALFAGPRLARDGGDPALVCVTSTGGGGSLLADHAMDYGIPLAGKDGEWTGRAAAAVASFAGAGPICNPIDGGNLGGWQRLNELFAALESDGLRGPVLSYLHMMPQLAGDQAIVDLLLRRKERTRAPSVVVSPGGLRDEIDAQYGRAGIPVFSDLATCFDSLRCLYDEMRFAGEPAANAVPASPAPPADVTAAVKAAAKGVGDGGVLSELESARILQQAGLPMVESRVVGSRDDAVHAAAALGYPVVLKAASREVAHKNAASLVVVGLGDRDALARAFAQMEARVGELGLAPGRVQYLLQPMLPSRAELIIGTTYEAPLGHFLVVGLGGIHAELIDSVLLLPVPMARDDLRRRIAEARLGALIAALERAPSGGSILDDVVGALDALQALVGSCGDLIKSIDVNPLLIGGARPVAVDALIVLNAEQ